MKDTTIPFERAERLRHLRTLCNLTKPELAEKIGCNQLTVSYWEKGVHGGFHEISANKIIIGLSAIAKCDTEWLLHGNGETPKLIS